LGSTPRRVFDASAELRNRASRTSITSRSINSHSHTIATRNPKRRNSLHLRASRLRLARSFSDQKSDRVTGTRENAPPLVLLQFLCPCQKHPLTKMAQLLDRLLMSGEPGSDDEFSR